MMELREVLIGVMVVGILAALCLLVLTEVKEETYKDTLHTEDIILVNGTAVGLTYKVASFVSLTNATNTSYSLPASNYTVNTATRPGSVTLIGDPFWDNCSGECGLQGPFDGNTTTITYVGEFGTAATVGTSNTEDAIAEIPSWLGILVIVIMAVFIIGYLLRAFYFNKSSTGTA